MTSGKKTLKKTFITTMPDEAGAFLKASRAIAAVGANISRVSYNRSVDVHLLFLDVAGTKRQLEEVSAELERIGYTPSLTSGADVILLEFKLPDVAGAVVPVLELIHGFDFNITYISSHENGTAYQFFKMGILIEQSSEIARFLEKASKLCDVRIIEYDSSEKVLDNTVFYLSFVRQMSDKLRLSAADTRELLTQSNLLMQLLDEQGELPQKTFGYIGKFADMLYSYKGTSFRPRVTTYLLQDALRAHLIEPPCGSNIFVYETLQGLLFVDSGFACYEQEMLQLLNQLIPDFDKQHKEVLLTHPDIDHSGLLHLFSRVHLSEEAQEHFLHELRGEPNSREANSLHAPYSRISRILSGYTPPKEDLLWSLGGAVDGTETSLPLTPLGALEVLDIRLEVLKGNGGHAAGEVVFIDTENKLVFSGDILVNPPGYTPEQRAFNALAPFLMNSVNMDSKKATAERDFLNKLYSQEEYTFIGGHGSPLGRILEKSKP